MSGNVWIRGKWKTAIQQVLITRQSCVCYVPLWMCIFWMVHGEIRIMQELMEDFVLGSAHGSCVKLFLNKWALFFIFENLESVSLFLSLSLSLSFFSPITQIPLLDLRSKCFLVYVTELIQGNSVKSRHTCGWRVPEKGQVVTFLLDNPALPKSTPASLESLSRNS